MPAEAMPVEAPKPLPGTVPYRREYRDPLGRLMRGEVSITPVPQPAPEEPDETNAQPPSPRDVTTVVRVKVTVKIPGGVLEVDLPPDTYTIVANLRTVDGERTSDRETVVIE